MSSTKDTAPRLPPQLASTLLSLLETNQYDQTESVLRKAQQKAREEGDQTGSSLLSAAHQLCISCRKLHCQIAYHEHAYQETVVQANELNTQLQLLLQDASQYLEKAASGSDPKVTIPAQKIEQQSSADEFVSSLWQRIQHFLGLSAGVQFQAKPQRDPKSITASSLKQHDNEIEERPLPPDPEPTFADAKSVNLAEPAKKRAIKSAAQDHKRGPPTLIVYCLGLFRVYYGPTFIVDWNGLKGQSIFKYLVTRQRKAATKDALMDLYWPDVDLDAARRNLHQAIYSLRKTLKNEDSDLQTIIFESDCYLLNPNIDIWLDYEEFENHLQAGRRLEQDGAIAQAMTEYGIAEGLYEGDFLAEDIYEEWTRPLREQLRREYIETTDRLSKQYLLQNEHTAAIAFCQKLLACDSCHEGAHRRLIRCYWAQNQRHLAIRQYHRCCETLRKELNVSPSEETKALFQELTSQ